MTSDVIILSQLLVTNESGVAGAAESSCGKPRAMHAQGESSYNGAVAQ